MARNAPYHWYPHLQALPAAFLSDRLLYGVIVMRAKYGTRR